MNRKEIKKWATECLLPLYHTKRGAPLKDKINEVIEVALEEGKVPPWIIKNILTELAAKHGYR